MNTVSLPHIYLRVASAPETVYRYAVGDLDSILEGRRLDKWHDDYQIAVSSREPRVIPRAAWSRIGDIKNLRTWVMDHIHPEDR